MYLFCKVAVVSVDLTHDIIFAQNELKDDKHIYSSRLYSLVDDQLQHWNDEVERYKTLTDSLQVIYLVFPLSSI